MPSVAAATIAANAAAAATRLKPRVVAVPEALAPLLPSGGLRRGAVVSVHGSTSLLFALLSTASAAGSWAAVVGRPDLGLLAAAEAGVAMERLALVPQPGVDLAAVTAALLDGIELVAVAGVERLSTEETRRLAARARQRGAVLLPLGDWPGAEIRLHGKQIVWDGLRQGHGRLRSLRVTVRATGRGAAVLPRTADVVLTGPALCRAGHPHPVGSGMRPQPRMSEPLRRRSAG
jgi:hypothetical protein